MNRVVMTFIRSTLLTLTLAFSMSSLAWADEAQEVGKLVKAGQLDQAATLADSFLATKPQDAQMRFLKGLILAQQGQTNDAIALFMKLTDDFPELPEPYNNLAVLYAAQGQYDKARIALEMSLRSNPNYAVAYENLGDVYARLASQAYEKSLAAGNGTAQGKLALMRDFNNRSGHEGSKKTTADTGATVKK